MSSLLQACTLIFDVLMGFISFGSIAVLFASTVGLAIWALYRITKALMD